MFFWPSVFCDAWGIKAQKPHILQETNVFLASPPKRQGGQNLRFCKVCSFLAVVPHASKKQPGQQKQIGIPLNKTSQVESPRRGGRRGRPT
jgi:hypothetical protein